MAPSRRARASDGRGRTPEVIVDFECSGGLLFVSVENIGVAPAHGVTVEFDKKVTGIDGAQEISSLNMFKNLEFLPPKKKIRAFVDSFHSYVARGQPMVVRTVIIYHGKDGRRLVDKATHDLSIYQDLPETS
jgi:hypothetical protein